MAALLEEAQVPLADLVRGHHPEDLRCGLRSAGSGDLGVSDDLLAVVQARDLSRRRALDRALEPHEPVAVLARRGGRPRGEHGCSLPWARTRTPSTRSPSRSRVSSRSGSSWVSSAGPRADRDGVGGGVGVRARTAARAPERPSPWRWPTVSRWRPGCSPSVALLVGDRPGAPSRPPWRSRKRSWPVPARKHRSWESRRRATDSPAAFGQLADLGLGHRTEREAHPRQRARREGAQHVALVLALVAGRPQQALLADAGVVAGGERVRRRGGRRARASRRAARCRCRRRRGWA